MCLVPTMLSADGPRHTRLRSSVASAFSARRVGNLTPLVTRVVRQRLGAVAQAGTFCVMSAVAGPVPMDVMVWLLGVPESDAKNFRCWARTLVASNFDRPDRLPGDAGLPATALLDLVGYLAALMAHRRRVPGDDLITALVHQPGGLDDADILSTVLLLLVAGHETTANLIGNTVLALLQHPAQRRLLESDWSLVDAAIEEGARYYSPVAVASWRFAATDLLLGNRRVPAGEPVRVVIAAANRDERQFPGAGEFDIARSRPAHLGFGLGPHFCLGAALGRLEARLVTRGLFTRFPRLRLAVDSDQLSWIQGHIMRGLAALPVRG
jgi:cytochrome P450